MTVWKNESQDTVQINFDIGNGKRELITLAPGAEIELNGKLDKYVPLEAPQLIAIKPKQEVVKTSFKRVK